MQYSLAILSNRPFFAVKDPGHFAKVNILVGEEMPTYNSYLRVNATKKIRKGAAAKREFESKIGVVSQKKEAESSKPPSKIESVSP